jgi:hypothetical protein
VKAEPSRLQVKVDPLLVDVKLKLAEVVVTVPEGPAVMLVSGGLTTVQLWLAGVASTLPVASVARTWNVCEPSAKAVYVAGEVQFVNDPLSSLQANVAASVAVKLKLAVEEFTVPVGPDVIVVSGGVLSTVTLILVVVVELFDGSTARAAIVAPPSAMEVEFQVRLYGDVVSVPTTAPFTRKLTEDTTTLSLAVAERVIFPLTLAPLAGAVSVTVGGVVSRILVVKLHDLLLSALPARSLMPVEPPLSDAV